MHFLLNSEQVLLELAKEAHSDKQAGGEYSNQLSKESNTEKTKTVTSTTEKEEKDVFDEEEEVATGTVSREISY